MMLLTYIAFLIGVRKAAQKAIKLLRGNGDLDQLSKCILTDFSDSQLYGLYATLALEAFQYEAETGSMRAIEWMLQCAGGLDLLSEFYQRYEILVTIGITFYNFVRDANFRYALTNETQIKFDQQYRLYRHIVSKFKEQFLDCTMRKQKQEIEELEFLADLITVAFVTSARIRDAQCHPDEMFTAKYFLEVRAREKARMPKLLLGLYEYQAAKLLYSSQDEFVLDYVEIFEYFSRAIQHLSHYKDNEHSIATYYYDAVYGELINFFIVS